MSCWKSLLTPAVLCVVVACSNDNPTAMSGGGMGMGPTPPWNLYDISIDPGEINDLSAEHPDLTAELVAEWEANWQ